jgi:uncharacterized protein YbjQ (UPF0145 family)
MKKPLAVEADGLRLGDGDAPTWSWTDVVDVDFPTSFSVRIALRSGQQRQVGFPDREQRRAFAAAYEDAVQAGVGSSHLPLPRLPTSPQTVQLLTISEVPKRAISQVLGLVSAHVVMSRGLFSDAGSDLKSVIGGNLGGIEAAIGQGLKEARNRLSADAARLGADAVVGIRIELTSVSDKAEAVLIVGTAVATRAQPRQVGSTYPGDD